jgi:hypothetical protein
MSLDEYNSGDIVRVVLKNGTAIEGVLIKPDYYSNNKHGVCYLLNKLSGSTPTRILIRDPNYKHSYNIITAFYDMCPHALPFSSGRLVSIRQYNYGSLLSVVSQILTELI